MARKAITKKLAAHPEQYGTRLHSPLHGLFKLKSSHMRVAYHIEKDLREVWVLVIGDRRTIWKDRQGEILDRLKREKAIARVSPLRGKCIHSTYMDDSLPIVIAAIGSRAL